MQRMTETTRMKMLMYVQAKGYGGVRLKLDGPPMGDTGGKCALGCAEMAALGAEISPFNMSCDVAKELTAGIGWTPPVIGKIHPALQSLEANLAARIPGQLSEVAPLAADKVHPALHITPRVAPDAAAPAQGQVAGKIDKVNVADPRALLNSYVKSSKVNLVAAPHKSLLGARAAYAEADEIMAAITHDPWGSGAKTLAIRGSTPANGFFQAVMKCTETMLQ